MRILRICCCFFVLFSTNLWCQVQRAVQKKDSAFADRVVERTDTLPKPLPSLGSAFITDQYSNVTGTNTTITKANRRAVQYQSLSELLRRSTPFQALWQGGMGQYNALSVLGGNQHSVALMVNGRPLSDIVSQAYHLELPSVESAEQTEILLGSDAIGLGASVQPVQINQQSVIHNTATPYMALWYSQAGGNMVGMDGTISQNIAPGLNVTIGVRRLGADGVYLGSDFDTWNIRTSARYTASKNLHLLLQYELSSLNTSYNGGITSAALSTGFTEEASPTLLLASRDHSRKHDLTLTGALLLAEDSTSILKTTVWFSSLDALRKQDSTLTPVPATPSAYVFHTRYSGVMGRYEQRIANILLTLGAQTELAVLNDIPNVSNTTLGTAQVFGNIRIPIGEQLSLHASARIGTEYGKAIGGFGGKVEYLLASKESMFADVSISQRVASVYEGLNLKAETHVLAIAGYKQKTLQILGFYRKIVDPIISFGGQDGTERIVRVSSQNATGYTALGLIGSSALTVSSFLIEPTIRLTLQSGLVNGNNTLPVAAGQLSVAYVYSAGTSTVHLGVRGALQSAFTPTTWVPLGFTAVASDINQPMRTNGLDAYLLAHVGNASVRFSFENIFAQRWYTQSIAPELTQNLRLSVTWSFFD